MDACCAAEVVRARLARVAHVVLVMSGKGGVGKSSATVLIAAALHRRGARVRGVTYIYENSIIFFYSLLRAAALIRPRSSRRFG